MRAISITLYTIGGLFGTVSLLARKTYIQHGLGSRSVPEYAREAEILTYLIPLCLDKLKGRISHRACDMHTLG